MIDGMFLALLPLVAVAGGVGAVGRFVLDAEVTAAARRRGASVPLGTAVVNVTGSLALGLLLGWAGARGAAEPAVLVVGTGLLGGYTTFSTAMVDSARLVAAGRPRAALGLLAGTLVLGVAAAAAGLVVGTALGG